MAFALGRMRNSRSGAVSSRTYAIAREIHGTTVSKWSKEYMKAKTVFKNIETGEKRILPVDEIDRTVWKGINYGNSLKRTVKNITRYSKIHTEIRIFLIHQILKLQNSI